MIGLLTDLLGCLLLAIPFIGVGSHVAADIFREWKSGRDYDRETREAYARQVATGQLPPRK